MVAVQLYQTTFRFHRRFVSPTNDATGFDTAPANGAAMLRQVVGQLEHLRLLGCFRRYEACWRIGSNKQSGAATKWHLRFRRALTWRRGIRRLCRGSVAHLVEAADMPLAYLCAHLARGPMKRVSDAVWVCGLGATTRILAQSVIPFEADSVFRELLAATWRASVETCSFGRATNTILVAANVTFALVTNSPRGRNASDFGGGIGDGGDYHSIGVDSAARTVEAIEGVALRHAIDLMDLLYSLAGRYPAELRSLRFDMLYPAELTPSGVCRVDKVRDALPPPERRWFRPALDGTRFYGPYPSVMAILHRLFEAGVKLSQWLVNLGSGDGKCEPGDEYDPANCLVSEGGWHGLLVEKQRPLAEAALERFAAVVGGGADGDAEHSSPCVVVLGQAVAPENVTLAVRLGEQALLAKVQQGHVLDGLGSPDLLKVDLDHADCFFVERLLADGIWPLLIHVEINPLFPPPLVYREHHFSYASATGAGQERGGDGDAGGVTVAPPSVDTHHHLIGCSLQAFVDATRRGGSLPYLVHHVEFENVVLVRPDLAGFLDLSPPSVPAVKETTLTQPVSPSPRKLRSMSPSSEMPTGQAPPVLLQMWFAGYFCHPLRGVMNDREYFAQHDFRPLLDARMPILTRAALTRRFLLRRWRRRAFDLVVR
eukprot:TRINITY_DN44558_c0_g1_i1.p1 TRINITY_DN44558_c0_g1~~TRINITY_DN44558_c0_g1_i1.p1  ORF type:complete len:730 (+),score=110.06 TRINITY_DN44558_c0_g1_i1:227-2191(+)